MLYEVITNDTEKDAKGNTQMTDRIHGLSGVDGSRMISLQSSKINRITSYNVCYTKLLRANADGFEGYDLMIVGRKGREYLKSRQGMNIVKVYENITGSISYSTAALIGQEVVEGYVAEKYDAVFFIYNAFRSAISQDVTIDKLLPIVPKAVAEGAHVAEYLYEPSRGEVLEQILPKHVEVQIFVITSYSIHYTKLYDQLADHLRGILAGAVHGAHAGAVLRGDRFEQTAEDAGLDVFREQLAEDLAAARS